VPKTRLAGNAFVPVQRSRALTTYVPPGSVAKGREIVTTGGVMRVGSEVVPRTTACSGPLSERRVL
jgi:hypothetical protein